MSVDAADDPVQFDDVTGSESDTFPEPRAHGAAVMNHLADVDDAADLLQRPFVDRQPGEPVSRTEVEYVVERGRHVDGDDVGTGDHHLPGGGRTQVEDGLDHVAFALVDGPGGLAGPEERGDVLAGDVGLFDAGVAAGEPVDAAGGQIEEGDGRIEEELEGREGPGDGSEDVCDAGCRQRESCARFDHCPKTGADVSDAETERWERLFWQEMKARGIFLTANQFESQFVSYGHTEEDVEETLKAYREAL